MRSPATSNANARGFTLLELLLVLGIGVTLFAVALPLSGRFGTASSLSTAGNTLEQNLRLVRSRSVSGWHGAPHGLFFALDPLGADRYTLYQGANYLARDPAYDQIITLDSGLDLSTNLPTPDLGFALGSGLPTAVGAFTLTDSTSLTLRTYRLNDLGLFFAE